MGIYFSNIINLEKKTLLLQQNNYINNNLNID